MVSAFERAAIETLVARATAKGVDVTDEVSAILHSANGSTGAGVWCDANPGDDDPNPGCCWGNVISGPRGCRCWQPVYDVEQAPPRPPASQVDLHAQPAMCGDCAYRPGSPERAEAYKEETLLDLAWSADTPFWCHAGMRRPVRWEHPDGRVVLGDPADWTPPMIDGIPYQADGSPGLLCAGWASIAARRSADRSEAL